MSGDFIVALRTQPVLRNIVRQGRWNLVFFMAESLPNVLYLKFDSLAAMNILKSSAHPPGWMKSLFWMAFAVGCFHLAYASMRFPAGGLMIFGYALALVRLSDQPTVRRAFYFGLAAGYLCCAPQLFFFWRIFGPAAIALWMVIAFWIGLFAAIVCGSVRRWGKANALWLIPVVWTGLEYFRSELYYLKFSWLNVGYALSGFRFNPFDVWGMYGVGFLMFAIIAVFVHRHLLKRALIGRLVVLLFLVLGSTFALQHLAAARYKTPGPPLSVAGVQMEFPPSNILPKALDRALAKNPDAQIFVLSEYTLDGPVPDSLKHWCRAHARFLVVGGKDPVGTNDYYNTAFVVGTNGEIVFHQAKCMPIQFFKDGLPAPGQEVWNSPWGKIGICICYDLSYTRVTDRLVEQGAQLLIVPTMDVEDWGRYEYALHARVAPVRAAEYGIPIFRLTSSGISQAITGEGRVIAQTSFGTSMEIIPMQFKLPVYGSLPLDRWLAPVCTVITAIVLVTLLFLAWNGRRLRRKN
jgi:apolipoprotein N-acyltransferase